MFYIPCKFDQFYATLFHVIFFNFIPGEIADNEDHGRDREVCEVVYEEVRWGGVGWGGEINKVIILID